MNKLILLLTASLFALPASAADSYTIDPTHTWPMFEVNHLGYSTQRGRFNKTSGKITLDIAARKGSVDLTIEADSLDMGFAQWSQHMKGEAFFDAAEYPTIRFTSDKLLFDGDNVIGAEGNFTLLRQTHPLTLKVEGFHCAPFPLTKKMHCGANVSATILRSQYGMARYLSMIGDEIKIFSPIEADKD
jgi:polyisoprenoid-binding protein YceI